jgi:hypothetical protein
MNENYKGRVPHPNVMVLDVRVGFPSCIKLGVLHLILGGAALKRCGKSVYSNAA